MTQDLCRQSQALVRREMIVRDKCLLQLQNYCESDISPAAPYARIPSPVRLIPNTVTAEAYLSATLLNARGA
jgi:hypothetical protein